jgi:hypothetical protein
MVILISLALMGCTKSGEFIRTSSGYITLTPHDKACRCVGTTEYWKVEGTVITESGWIGTEPLYPNMKPVGNAYIKSTGTIEMNQAGNRIEIDAFIKTDTGNIHRSGTYYLKQTHR